LIGAIASIVVWRHGAKLARAQWHRRLAPVALAAIGVAWLVGANGAWLYRGGLAALAVATSIVLVTITTAREGVLQRVLGVRPLVALGVISYGVYLFHWPIYEWLSPERTGMSGLSLLVVRVATTLAAATVSYVAVEHPYRSRRGPIAWRAVGAVSAVTALLVLAVQLPIPARLDPQRAALVVRSVPTVPTASTIPNAGAVTPAPTVPTPTPTHLLVVGDSVALRLATGFSDQSAAGVDVQDLGTTFCGMGDQWPEMHIRENLITDRCADWRTAWPAAADDMGANGTLAVFGIETSVRLIDGQWREACDPVYDNWLQSTVRDLIGALGARGPVWVALAPYNRAPTSVDESTLAQRDEHTDCTNHDYAVAVALGGPHGHLIDLSSFVCPDASTCTDIVGGITLRPDGLHYEGPGADVVARWLLDQVGDP
jgi:hypothetical protein